MTIGGQMSESDCVAAQYLHFRPRAPLTILALAFIAVSIAVAWLAQSLLLILGLVFLLGFIGFYIPFNAKRNFRLYKALREPTKVEVREQGIFFRRSNGEALIPWTEIIKWKKNNNLVILYPSKSIFHLLPAHYFDSEQAFADFKTRLEMHLGKSA